MIPVNAKIQVKEKISHPVFPANVIIVKGV